MSLENEIKEIVSVIIQVSIDEIDSEASFFDDYGMDSLRALEILAEIENRYQIIIDPEKLMKMTNVAEVVNITREYLENGKV